MPRKSSRVPEVCQPCTIQCTSSHLMHVTPALVLSFYLSLYMKMQYTSLYREGGWSKVRIPARGKTFFSCTNRPDRLLGPTLQPTQCRRALPAVKRPGYDVYRSLPSSAEVPVCLHGVRRDNFTYVCLFVVCFPGITTHRGCIFHNPVAGFSLLVFEVSSSQRRATVGRTPLD